MNIKLTLKRIQDRCGMVSFKRGEAFFRANKVVLENDSNDFCSATVIGVEEFQVTIEKNVNGDMLTTCSCPTLSSYDMDCQHIAAVLLAMHEKQRQKMPANAQDWLVDNTEQLSQGLLSLFSESTPLPSRQQRHFEKRKVLDVTFICKLVSINSGSDMFGIEMTVGQANVLHIRDFLKHLRQGEKSLLSISFTYDPSMHCFTKNTDSVMQQLVHVMDDEKLYLETMPEHADTILPEQMLLIPPSSWERLMPLLVQTPSVKLAYDDNTFDGIQLTDDPLPLQFDIGGSDQQGYQLKISGLQQLIVLAPYKSVLYQGKIAQLVDEDRDRLFELKQRMEVSGKNIIHIPHDQLQLYLKRVVPVLRRLGHVVVSSDVSGELAKTPLLAKLYLDRVKNRLLAGLEFHYDHHIIHPVESEDSQSGTIVIRDVEKENMILQLMDDSGFTKTDGGYVLHNESLEYQFLYHVLPELQQMVQVYATTAIRNRIFRANPRPKIRVKHKRERTNWLEFKFVLDGIPEREIREVLLALEENRKYYRLRDGALLSLETREFEEIQRFLQAVPVQDEDLVVGLSMPIIRGIQLIDTIEDDQLVSMEQSFRSLLENIRNPSASAYQVPTSLDAVLRDYQKHGYRWMKTLAGYGFGGVLADDMGLGKTVQSIAFILSELSTIRTEKQPVLIVCPSSVTYNWLKEMMHFAPEIQAVIMDGKVADRLKLQNTIANIDVLITSYPLLRSDIKWYEQQAFHTVFFDEAQAFKNPTTQTARAVKKLQATNRFALTGTPIENSIEELWSIYHVVFPELFQGLKEYSKLTNKKISRRVRPFLLRRMKADVLEELPGKEASNEAVELLPEQKKLYAAYLAKLRHDTLKHLDRDTIRKNRIKILAGLTRLRQICCHPALFVDGYKGRSAKLESLMGLIAEAKQTGRRVLIFSQFTKMLEIIGKELTKQGRSYFYLDGQTPAAERVERCSRFNTGERDLFLISLNAGGTGLNLTGADTVILYDNWWNPAVEEQAADRAHRMGQKHEVRVIKLVARGTIEDKMNELQAKKRDLITEIIDATDASTATLTDEDIRELLMI